MKSFAQTANALVLVRFDESISLPPLTAKKNDLRAAIALYLRRVFGPEADLQVNLGRTGQVTSNGVLVATFKVAPLERYAADRSGNAASKTPAPIAA